MRAPHTLRARLVAVHTLVAVVVVGAGVALFAVLLRRGVTSSIDATLAARALPVVAAVASRPPAANDAAPVTGLPSGLARADGADGSAPAGPSVDSFIAVYRPDGAVGQFQPAELRSSPLSAAQVVAGRRGPRYERADLGDERLRVLISPVRRADGIWMVAVGTAVGPPSAAADTAVREVELAAVVLVALAALSAWLLSGAALRPVERMRADAASLGEHDPANRLSVPDTDDELARLALTFNALLDRLHRSLGRQRDLIADAGHELRTPLAVLRIELELADDPELSRDDLADSVAHARGEVERLSHLAEDLLFLARADRAGALAPLGEVDLGSVVADSARAWRAGADAVGISIEVSVAPPCPVRVDAAAMRRAVDNLVANAVAVSAAGDTITLAVRRSGALVEMAVADEGPGFAESFLAQAFERFARHDPARSSGAGGAGLGLAIVREIAVAHRGTVGATNNAGRGATVTITVPSNRHAGGDPAGGSDRISVTGVPSGHP